ncbi:MAG: Dolichyl-phosphate-mannose-mannosyltransferase family protein [Candidatus Collierbacteria bacterium GW2011_GWB1_45_35]|uniref:Dolichyl-phosphate-mannose-mannosyltransferase family protein n=2 Tax=Candidatus Collieribacteriota TaxID=1752725 RepID=A0A0G1KT96_9BACT|nr:MAG: Dolichyl-phosphate-mannose-mannosyltransferase family protein [Microgenomates group bacterium GW2011_GWC1_44_23]KKT86740.1 MAG: Dolichyl-phosphate-mannose-mannosyltransferase family protein [Candidatus Collierbacteria bacterium GW2011_GWA2_44_99]KKT95914.1 MAG: Dolichyl-phosphate-mannose-mannosyltransferase family protein [Candidatus Collierbacteria bacterium GW2011_GWA1_45_15]KKU00982.1 MAG: Dolichyl-phosphate-mannose-mannosyltransferase family protein [Candidatus Collierbacteria bacter
MIKKILILGILVLALLLRLYKLDNPVADWHSFRQADTASVTRNFVDKGVNMLVPTYHDNSNIQSGKDNPNGYRMVELPLYNLLHYSVYELFPSLGVDQAGRLTSVILSLISIYLVYLIGEKLSGFFVGWLAALFMAVLPFSIYYSRVILPEPLMIASILGSYWYLIKMSESTGVKKRYNLLISSLLFAIALLVKPFAIFFALPNAAIVFRSWAKGELHTLDVIFFSILGVAPFIWWRNHILSYPTGIPASDWLINSTGIRFRPAWFRWLFSERIGKLILGVYGTTFLMLGLIAKPKNEGVAYWLWALGILLYFSVIAGGNVQHDYYQAIIIPFLCFLLAKGVALVLSLSRTTYSRLLTIIMTLVIFVSMISISWYDIKGYYQVNNWPIVEAGKEVDRLTPKDAKVIAPYNGDTAFLYQTHRSGWPLGYDIEDKMAKGATYYVSVSYDDESRTLEKKYTLIEKTDRFIIIKLSK